MKRRIHSVQRNWLPQLKESFQGLTRTDAGPVGEKPAPAAIAALPVHLVPGAPGVSGSDALALLITGDGGWVGIDRDLARTLAAGV